MHRAWVVILLLGCNHSTTHAPDAAVADAQGANPDSPIATFDAAPSKADAASFVDAFVADAFVADAFVADANLCGDNVCESLETPATCAADCGNILFLTAEAWQTYWFTDLTQADGLCRTRAQLAHLDANGRVAQAWISKSANPASARLPHSSFPYRNMNGDLVASDWTQLTSATASISLVNPILYDETTTARPGVSVWTGTNADASSAGATCADWKDSSLAYTGVTGLADATNMRWTEDVTPTCDQTYSIYCVLECTGAGCQ